MPTEHDYIDVRDLFVSINPNGLDQSELARDGASFVEPQTINDYHLFRAGYQAALEAQQGQGEPIMLAAVGELQEDGDGGLEVQWLLEGGTSELLHGMTLLVAENAPDLCREEGSAQVYTHADPAEVARLELEIDQLRLSLTMNDCASVEDECVRTENRQLNDEVERLRAESARLVGLKPECPPRPPASDGLPRYGLHWNGAQQPIAMPMDDGYWTPWHLADRIREDRDSLLKAGGHLL